MPCHLKRYQEFAKQESMNMKHYVQRHQSVNECDLLDRNNGKSYLARGQEKWVMLLEKLVDTKLWHQTCML